MLPYCIIGTVAKILLVEDNEMNADMLSRRLRRRGYDVTVVSDGRAGVDEVLANSPDVVLMDMSLPVLDGWSATREIRERQAGRAVPIIALTAHALSTDRDKALDAGCDDYDTKPIEFSRLEDKIKKALGRT